MTAYFIVLLYPSLLCGSKGRYSLLVDAQKFSLAGKTIAFKEEKSSAKVKELENIKICFPSGINNSNGSYFA